jgi:GGDEF domain-containing protein
MVIECERLASAAARDAGGIGGVLSAHKFKEYGEREILRGKELSDVISLVVLGIPAADAHRPAIAQMRAGFMPELATKLLEFVSAFDLVCKWNEETVLVLLQASSVDEATALAREAQRLGAGWFIKQQFSLDASMCVPAAAISCYPQHGQKLQELIETTLRTFEQCTGTTEGSIKVTE